MVLAMQNSVLTRAKSGSYILRWVMCQVDMCVCEEAREEAREEDEGHSKLASVSLTTRSACDASTANAAKRATETSH